MCVWPCCTLALLLWNRYVYPELILEKVICKLNRSDNTCKWVSLKLILEKKTVEGLVSNKKLSDWPSCKRLLGGCHCRPVASYRVDIACRSPLIGQAGSHRLSFTLPIREAVKDKVRWNGISREERRPSALQLQLQIRCQVSTMWAVLRSSFYEIDIAHSPD
jgi:hypothetical protein